MKIVIVIHSWNHISCLIKLTKIISHKRCYWRIIRFIKLPTEIISESSNRYTENHLLMLIGTIMSFLMKSLRKKWLFGLTRLMEQRASQKDTHITLQVWSELLSINVLVLESFINHSITNSISKEEPTLALLSVGYSLKISFLISWSDFKELPHWCLFQQMTRSLMIIMECGLVLHTMKTKESWMI